jgi:ribosomal protein S18 acetylase RimI-like enzyme
MTIKIDKIENELQTEAIELLYQAFVDDPLYKFIFPDEHKRTELTKSMYEFVVHEMVPGLNLTMKGAYTDKDNLLGCMIYTTLNSMDWNDKLTNAAIEMRKKANDKRMELIGEYASLCSEYRPEVKHFYGNELAVRKEYRNQGIAKLLVFNMIEDFQNNPDAEIIAIDTTNEENVLLYQKWGWKLNASFDFYDIKVYSMWMGK